jgi:flagellar hook-associated protein 2
MAVSFSGLATGLNTSQLITQLVAVERNGANNLVTQQSNLSSQQSILGNLTNQLSSLGSVATDMKTAASLQFRAATSSDGHVAIAVSGSATPTTHDIRVIQTARAQVVSSKGFATDAAGILGAGGVDLTTGTGSPVHVAWDATDSLSSIASKINSANTSLGASVLYDGSQYRLVLSSKATGTANAATFVDSGDGLDLSNAANIRIPAQDAKLNIDGIPVTRPTNVIADAIPGVTITAVSPHATGDADALVAVTLDTTATEKKLQSLVNAYNQVNSVIGGQLTYFGSTKGQNTLFGDSALRGLQGQLTSALTSPYGGSNLGAIGISRDKTGAMSLDTAKLTAALTADPTAIQKIFADGGLAAKLATLTDSYARGSDGVIALKSKALSERSASIGKQIDLINKNADSLQTRLQAQFSALESAMSKMQSQSSYLSKLFA